MPKGEKQDKYSFRGDADTFDTDMFGPGHVPPHDGTKASKQWESWNWGGQHTNDWETTTKAGQ